jgi:mannose-6-phosphate isomerase-like protein (cupin superfamily)
MAGPFTVKSLTEVEDSAPGFGLEGLLQMRFAGADLEADDTGFSLVSVAPGKRPGLAHRHDQAEEVYVVLSGAGRMKLDDEVVEVSRLDAIRVAPAVTRSFEAGPEGLEVLAFGARHDGDGEVFFDWWAD